MFCGIEGEVQTNCLNMLTPTAVNSFATTLPARTSLKSWGSTVGLCAWVGFAYQVDVPEHQEISAR